MRTDRVQFVSAIQAAFVDAVAAELAQPKRATRLVLKVARKLDHTKPLAERAINARVSYRTAQKLKQEGVL